ncbi:TadG family pilus assembly protein [Sphingobium sp. AP49]|uniref:TadG family pilus assembly protein n=1 Tax=Sphingobium sp. AP49 TaxID=1144307 RepID=UPI00026EDD26|nr:TadG family pilus assembly protein [Sphingobium sp. AP49]WHO37113.1 TadG family pilus assembly protein [Sphingobium sp. AP49]
MKGSGTMMKRLRQDHRGGISVLLAGALFMLAGASTVAVDLGSVYLAKRQLQGIADAAAIAASGGGRSAAEQLLTKSGVNALSLITVDNGYYASDTSVPIANRFIAGDARANATRVEVQRHAPLFFAKLLVGRDGVDVRAHATAARSDAAAFSLGTGLASLSGGLPNMLLSALAGTELNLSVMDYQGLASLNVDLLHFADALKVRTGRNDAAYGELFGANIPLSDIIGAIADTADNSSTAGVLRTMAGKVPGKTVKLSDIVDLGPMKGTGSSTGQPSLLLDAFSMLRMVLSPPAGTAVPIDLTLNVPGLTSTRLTMVTGTGQTSTPMISITNDKNVVLRTAQTRIYLDSKVGTALSGIANLRIPLYVELASAEARLSDVVCDQAALNRGVTLAVTPSIGTAALAEVDNAALTNFSIPANPRPVVMASVLGSLTQVSGYANIALGGVTPQNVLFTPGDIAAQQAKMVSTQDLTQGLAASLANQTKVTVTLAGIPLPLSPLISPVAGLLGTTAPILDGLLNNVTGLLGVKLGTASVKVHQMRCGMPTLVA